MTTTDTRCVHEMLPGQCATCRHLPDPPQARVGRPIVARYAGQCRSCRSPYTEGDTIRRITDDEGTGYVGPCCQED